MWRDLPKLSVDIFSAVTDLIQLSNSPTLCFRTFRTLLSSLRAAILETALQSLLGLILSARGL